LAPVEEGTVAGGGQPSDEFM